MTPCPVIPDTCGVTIYLDIETAWSGAITVIGMYSRERGLVQLVGDDITHDALAELLPAGSALVTFNGHCFDLPVIRRELGLDTRARCASRDLRFMAKRVGLTGGLKAIEVQLGIPRRLAGMNGMDALYLWERYRREGDRHALATLLAYNEEDVVNLPVLESHIVERMPRVGRKEVSHVSSVD